MSRCLRTCSIRGKSSVSIHIAAAVTFLCAIMRSTAAAWTDHSSRIIRYEAPVWARGVLKKVPEGRIALGNPTPMYQLVDANYLGSRKKEGSILGKLSGMGVNFYVKRDDMTGGVEFGGNKIRKLEFLLADALKKGCDSVVTIGGEQSNHCRATAAAARMLGMEPHLILRTRRADTVQTEEEFGLTGNIMFDRMVGSHIYTCTPGEYGRFGSNELVNRVCDYLKSPMGGSLKPMAIPVGGSSAIGSWGYIEAVNEFVSHQWKDLSTLGHIVLATGSGGTATGIALGIALAAGAGGHGPVASMPKIHAIGVCDDPDYFYKQAAAIANDMGLTLPSNDLSTEDFVRQHMIVYQGKGQGYAVSTQDELKFVVDFARETGIVLDPVYSGKALYNFISNVVESDPSFRGSNVVFWHTGGALGLYDKEESLLPGLSVVSPVSRMDLYSKGLDNAIDLGGV